MHKINDCLVYGKDVCHVKNINTINNQEYYSLEPINDSSLKITIPINSNRIRNLISKDELSNIINNMSRIDIINIEEKFIESEYKRLLTNGTSIDLIRIIKTIYLRNKERAKNKKRIMDKDKEYIDKAKEILYNELRIVLDLSFEDTKEYIINIFEELLKES